jgi:predicted O-methyltransferase YrrM
MTPELFREIDAYIESLFVDDDPILAQALKDATSAGLPQIQISPSQGKALYLLAKMRGARHILEIGTLGGYSTTWLARALPEMGTLTTLEVNQKHADVARKNLDRAGFTSNVRIEVGPAANTMRRMIERRETPFDLIFIDADKPGYAEYLDLSLELSRPGTVILADNLIRDGEVMDANAADENARAARAFNQQLSAHPRLESIIVPFVKTRVDGMSISIVKS